MPVQAEPLKAVFWMSGAIFSFSSMAIAGRELSTELDTFEIMMYRSFIGIVIVLAVAAVAGRLNHIHFRQLRLHGLRNLAHFTGQNLWFYALTLIPLAQLFALEFTSPIWVLLLSPLFLGERLTLVRIASALIGFVGILIVTRPTPDSINLGIILAAVSAVCFALTTLATKRLTRTEPITAILFHLTVMQAVMGVICAGYDLDIAWPSLASLPFVLVVGLGGLLAHFCIAKALSLAPATVVVPIDFIRLPAIAVVGMLLYSEPLDLFVLVGALVIFAANYLNIWSETRKHA
ncbi:DMT family transporter [Alisedimentitalea sp. MJ-SS2]|uniref:DMT family transporter n=1 Tax=Aliisedimentitalea sp. MJ-SS2 TaxID=3049795 RepID=UPI00290700C4|nr:DMT family transporter [Alisedimentitalea sp. MJ-SS2]MDU8926872.1 DMT family transporter [Alisedimentitalea sp. MJ-SS2]